MVANPVFILVSHKRGSRFITEPSHIRLVEIHEAIYTYIVNSYILNEGMCYWSILHLIKMVRT